MRKIREALRLHYECGCENRQIALACCISPSTVSDYLKKAERQVRESPCDEYLDCTGHTTHPIDVQRAKYPW